MRWSASTRRASVSLLISMIWPIEGSLGVGAEERVLALGAVDLGATRAASSRRGSASGRCAGRRGRPGGSRTAGAGPCVGGLADAAERRAAEDAGALDEPLGDEVLGVQAERGAGGGELLAVGRRPARRRRWRARSCASGGRTGGPWRRRRPRRRRASGVGGRRPRGGLGVGLGLVLGRRRGGQRRGACVPVSLSAFLVAALRASGRSWRRCRGARTCTCCRRRPGRRRSGRGACSCRA